MKNKQQQRLVSAMIRALTDYYGQRGDPMWHLEIALEELTGEKWTSGPINDQDTGRISIGYPYARDRLQERGLLERRS